MLASLFRLVSTYFHYLNELAITAHISKATSYFYEFLCSARKIGI